MFELFLELKLPCLCCDNTHVVVHVIEEFVAHTDTVNCVTIGRKSGRVIATGGDDRVVNIWAVGQPNMLMVRFLNTPYSKIASFRSCSCKTEWIFGGVGGSTNFLTQAASDRYFACLLLSV